MEVSFHCDRALAELQQLLNPAWAPRQAPLVVFACHGHAEADMPARRGGDINAEPELNRLEEEAEALELPDVAPLTSVQVGWATDISTGSPFTAQCCAQPLPSIAPPSPPLADIALSNPIASGGRSPTSCHTCAAALACGNGGCQCLWRARDASHAVANGFFSAALKWLAAAASFAWLVALNWLTSQLPRPPESHYISCRCA